MFGCLATYVKDKIVLILRDKLQNTADNGVWLATTEEHHESLRRDFPNMRSVQVLGKPVTGWQVLPTDAPDFEDAALRTCELILIMNGQYSSALGNDQGDVVMLLGARAELLDFFHDGGDNVLGRARGILAQGLD